MHKILQPEGWSPPRGYSNGMAASGRFVFVSGQVGWNAKGVMVSDDLVAQIRQALENIATVLASGDARPEHITALTWYFTDKTEYLARSKEVGAAYRAVMGKHFPAMTALEVSGLVEPGAKVEIQAVAVVPS
jgi:enamine deaminase RidA (YjgF/YER057c/UK114 family)